MHARLQVSVPVFYVNDDEKDKNIVDETKTKTKIKTRQE